MIKETVRVVLAPDILEDVIVLYLCQTILAENYQSSTMNVLDHLRVVILCYVLRKL